MKDPVAGLVGLARRAGRLVVGTAGVRAGLRRGEVAVVVVADDLSERTAAKVVRLADGRGVPVVRGPAARMLGQVLGRSTVQAVGVTDQQLARGLLARSSSSPGGQCGD